MTRLQAGIRSAFLIAAAACGSVEGKTVARFEHVPVVPFDSLYTRVDSVMLDTPADEAIGRASGIVVLPGSIVLSDVTRGNLKVFNRKGLMLRTIGRPGDGPGEFRRPVGLVRDGSGRLVVLDLSRNILAVLDTTGTLLEERVVVGPWDNLAAIPGSEHVLLTGGRVRKGREQGVAGEQMAVHDVDPAGGITTSYHSFKWPEDPFQSSFNHFFAAAVGQHLVTGTFASNRVYFVDRSTGAETSAIIGGPWYKAPAWSTKPPAQAGGNPVETWAKEQILLTRLMTIDGGRFLAQFKLYDRNGDEMFQYVIADTDGNSLVSTAPTRLRILLVEGNTAYGVTPNADGDLAFETLVLTKLGRR